MTSELGCITPWIIAPAVFTEEELKHHALHLATAFLQNNSCNCNAPKLLVLSEAWPQKAPFLAMLKAIMTGRPFPVPYYPGTASRYTAFEEKYPDAYRLESSLPPQALPPPDPKYGAAPPPLFIELGYERFTPLGSEGHEYALHNEPFAPVLLIANVPADKDFFAEAPRLCNECVLGTLSATLVAHPSIEDEKVEAAVEALRYGTVALNCWTGSTFQFEAGSWGAFPGETLDNVQSGIGAVRNYMLFDPHPHPEFPNPRPNGRNYMLFDHVQKSVVRSPFLCPSHIGCSPTKMTLQQERPTLALAPRPSPSPSLSGPVPDNDHDGGRGHDPPQ